MLPGFGMCFKPPDIDDLLHDGYILFFWEKMGVGAEGKKVGELFDS